VLKWSNRSGDLSPSTTNNFLMTASPQDVTSDMALIEKHWQEGLKLQHDGAFTLEEWSLHQAISYAGLLVLGVDGIQRLCRELTAGNRSMACH